MWPLWLVLTAMVVSYVLTYPSIAIGRNWRILDIPDGQRRLHRRATPCTGGLPVFLTMLVGVCLLGAFDRFSLGLLSSMGLLCAVGLWDGRWGMQAWSKFCCQVVCVLPFVVWGRDLSSISLFGWHTHSDWLATPIVLFWLVACTNFVNLIDGLDGLATAVSLVAALAIAALAWLDGAPQVAALALMLAGALVGFLVHNWPPAKVFLGDCGSLPLGFLIGALSLEATAKKTTGLTLSLPLAIMSIPLFDTSMAILRRRLAGRAIGQADREHIHHCLCRHGLSSTQALLAIAGMCTGTAGSAIVATILNNDWIALASCAILWGALIGWRVFGYAEVQLLWDQVRSLAGRAVMPAAGVALIPGPRIAACRRADRDNTLQPIT